MVDAAAYLQAKTSEKLTLTPLSIGSMMPELDIGDDAHEGKKPGSEKSDTADAMSHESGKTAVGE